MKYTHGSVIKLQPACRHCGHGEGVVKRVVDGPHHYSLECMECEGFIQWVKKDENQGKNNRNKSRKIAKAQRDYCEMCLLGHDQMFGRNRLEGHHIIPVKDGGGDNPENISTLCHRCHKLIETYRKTIWDIVEPRLLKKAA